jgi:hypothetical protein
MRLGNTREPSVLDDAFRDALRRPTAGDATGAARSFSENHADEDGWTLKGHNPEVLRIRKLAEEVDMSRRRVKL